MPHWKVAQKPGNQKQGHTNDSQFITAMFATIYKLKTLAKIIGNCVSDVLHLDLSMQSFIVLYCILTHHPK